VNLLIILTLIYAAVLVVALAASLIAIFIYLRRIGRALGEAREALSAVSRATAPLEEHLQHLQDATASSAQELEQATRQLENANDQLTVIVERLGAEESVWQ
jgi:DNA-binding transcriptional MerR regulator